MLPFATLTEQSELYHEVEIAQVIAETADAKTFVLRPVGWELKYKPGQFLTFVIPTLQGHVRRSYSFSSVPPEAPAVTVKRMANGVLSRPLLESGAAGDRLTVAGRSSGFFTLPDNLQDYEQIVFIAGGSGITPVFSLIKALAALPRAPSVLLAYSNKSPNRTIFREPLEALEKEGKLEIEWYFSERQDLLRARLSKTTIGSLLERRLKVRITKTLAYLCGPFDFMRTAAIVLQSMGMPSDNIRREVFTPDVIKVNDLPPDTDAHHVTLLIGGRRHEFRVQYPDTILTAAKRRGIELPYSCESGRCGSCIAQCVEGKIWIRYNEVLTDKEVEAGRILVCQSFPVAGDAVIEYN